MKKKYFFEYDPGEESVLIYLTADNALSGMDTSGEANLGVVEWEESQMHEAIMAIATEEYNRDLKDFKQYPGEHEEPEKPELTELLKNTSCIDVSVPFFKTTFGSSIFSDHVNSRNI